MYHRKKTVKIVRHNTGHSLVDEEICSVNDLEDEAELLLDQAVEKENYDIIKKVGRGGYGAVYLAKSAVDDQLVAIKRTPHKSSKEQRKNFQEIRLLQYCDHPNIIRFVRGTLYGEDMWIVNEFVDGGTLTTAIIKHNFTESEIVYITSRCASAIGFLHNVQVAHRDLKSGNIMLGKNGDVKIIDFGLCSDISQGKVVHMVGSPFWMPPEMIKREPHGLEIDIWSLGICILEMANGFPPNRQSGFRAMFEAASFGYPYPFDNPEAWSESFKDFMSHMLNKLPEDRWTINQLLEHPFLSSPSPSLSEMSTLLTDIFTNEYIF
eukprot:TRINITY_DN1415_c0_g1_i1.p1 TRINITY_DN1415_c0_g1~~TRINITY_DN1415_c0_g1_i1.p1  ORF type:complete len:321 (+),score=69.13 TRINITY_DN1415_c0_g1_i1:263-1225(+)